MRKLALLFMAAFMIGLVSCGGSENKEEAQEAKQAVEQKADEVKQEAQEATQEAQGAAEEKQEEATPAGEAQASGKDGAALFADNGCTACHKEQQKNIGPSLKDIAAAYAGKEDALFKFLKGEGEAIVDPAQFAVMQPNLEITKKMNDDDVKAIVSYIMSVK